MTNYDPLALAGEVGDVLDFVAEAARKYLETLDDRPVRLGDTEAATRAFDQRLPDAGDGALEALRFLLDHGSDAVVASGGPRFFHFVIGGATPAALGGDLLTSVLDQNAGAWAATPLGSQLESVTLSWLLDLFALPDDWGGVLTTGATMANFTCLAAARQWWGSAHGVDVAASGLTGLPPAPVFSSGYIHASARKALSMLGLGYSSVETFRRDEVGRLDLKALEEALERLRGSPAIIIANAGEVDAGDFDPIGAMADLAGRYGAWLHVDGAFGLFAAVAPETAHLTADVEKAHSVAADGHKWLNVPYDCGFAFLRDPALLPQTFRSSADYLPPVDDPRPNYMYLGPEMSRRARSIAVWATLRAYGRQGYRALVERHLRLAQRLASRVDEAPELERLAPVTLSIVCFRYRPESLDEEELNELNRLLGDAILADGRVYAGTTRYAGKVSLRPAMVNWRTTEKDVDLFVEVVRQLAAGL